MKNEMNTKYQVELEVLSPLHVGAGAEKDWMKGADYISDNGKVYILNHRKVADQLSANELSNFLVSKNDGGLKNKLSGKLESVSDLVFDEPAKSDNDIKTFIKNGLTNKPFVPGSSIKGAIRSILFAYLIDDKKDIDKKDKNFETKIFGSANEGDEFMRFVKISDAQFEKTELVNTKVFNLFGKPPHLNGGWKHEFKGGTNNSFSPFGFNTIYEILPPHQRGQLSIMLSIEAFNNLKEQVAKHDEKKAILQKHPSLALFKIINEHTKAYIHKEIAFFEKYANNETNAIIASLKTVLANIPEDNSSCVFKMSAGSGFHSITGDWQFDDFSIDGVKTPERGPSRGQLHQNNSTKSRKIATDGDRFEMMGFVKLSILTDEIIAKRKAQLEAERKQEEERIQAEKAEQERIEAERKAQIEAEQEAEAERLAKEKAAKEARDLFLQQREEEKKQRQEANKLKQQAVKKKTLEKGLIEIEKLNDFGKGKSIVETYFKTIEGDTIIDPIQLKILKAFISQCIQKSSKRWKKEGDKDWKLIIKWVGKTTASQWYKEMI